MTFVSAKASINAISSSGTGHGHLGEVATMRALWCVLEDDGVRLAAAQDKGRGAKSRMAQRALALDQDDIWVLGS